MAYQTIPPSASGGDVPGDPFVSDQTEFLQGLIPQLNRFGYIDVGQFPLGGAAATSTTNDGAVEGGGRTASNAAFTLFGASLFQTCNTGRWGISFRARFLAASAGQTNAVGVVNGAGTHDVFVGAVGSISTANYGLAADGTTSTSDDCGVANDLGFHTFAITGDTANIRVYIDGTLRATRAIGTNVVDEPMFPMIYNTATTETVLTDYLYGYVL